jgi:hypothetical protein
MAAVSPCDKLEYSSVSLHRGEHIRAGRCWQTSDMRSFAPVANAIQRCLQPAQVSLIVTASFGSQFQRSDRLSALDSGRARVVHTMIVSTTVLPIP